MILIDSGVSGNRDVGDNAILDLTINHLVRFDTVCVLEADFPWAKRFRSRLLQNLLFLFKITVKCDRLWICSGGLFKHKGWAFILRKLIVVAIARFFRKPIYVDAQTVYLKGFWKALFKLVFRGLTINCRDDFSLLECKTLGLKCKRKEDIVFKKPLRGKTIQGRVVVDGRYKFSPPVVKEFVEKWISKNVRNHKNLIEVPTIQTSLDWRKIEKTFQTAEIAICVSFHAAVFAYNAGVKRIICVYNDEYYHRKFSVFSNAEKIDLRRKHKFNSIEHHFSTRPSYKNV